MCSLFSQLKSHLILGKKHGLTKEEVVETITYDKYVVIVDLNLDYANETAKALYNAGFEISSMQADLNSRESIQELIKHATSFENITGLVCGAGVSPSQAPADLVLKVDLYGTSVLMEEFGKVIAKGGVGIIITPLANDELNGPRGDNYRKMIDNCPAKRAGTPDEIGDFAAYLMSEKAGFITGADFLIDGGTTASYWYGDLSYMRNTMGK